MSRCRQRRRNKSAMGSDEPEAELKMCEIGGDEQKEVMIKS